MQVSVETTEGLERKVTVEVPAQEIDGEVERRVADAAKKVRLDGFRPGKVPLKVVRQRFGESLRQEVVAEVAQRSFFQAVSQESLKPVGDPRIEPVTNTAGENFTFTAVFEVLPEIELCSFSDIKVEKPVAEVVDADVENMIDKLRDQQATWSEVDRAAASGDKVNIDYVGTRDGEEFDGGSANGTDLELGSGSMIEGFEAGLEGASAKEERVLDLQFPEEYHSEELAGAKVQFKVTVNGVSEKTLPELNDEFFSRYEVAEGGLEAFKKNVRESMEKQLQDSIQTKLKDQVMNGLYDAMDMELPTSMIDAEIKVLKGQSISRFGVGEDFDDSLLPDELFKEQAEKRVALGVILNKVIDVHQIKPDRDRVIEFIGDLAASYEDPAEVRDYYLGDEQRLQQVQLMVAEQMVVEKILDEAEVSENSCNYDEAVKAE